MGSNFNRDKVAATRSELRDRNTETYQAWLETHPEVVPCQANLSMFMAYVDFAEQELAPADLDFALGNLRDHLALQRVPTPQEVVDAENKRRKSLSLPALGELARRENPKPQRGELPQVWYDHDISTPQALRELAKKNIDAFKALTMRFGTTAINDRLGYTAPKQFGHGVKF